MVSSQVTRGVLAGNMWAQSWTGLESLLRPFANKTGVDVTQEMRRQVDGEANTNYFINSNNKSSFQTHFGPYTQKSNKKN